MRCDCQELSAYCLYTFIDEEDRNCKILFYFMNNRMQTDLRFKIIQNHISLKWNTVINYYSVFRIASFEICDFRFLKFSAQISIF